MKIFILRTLGALTFLVSIEAFACPNLAGTFTCTQEDGTTSPLNVTQSYTDGIVTYTFNKLTLPVDWEDHPMPIESNLRNGKVRGRCYDDVTLHTEVAGQVYIGGNYLGDLTGTRDYSLKNGILQVKSSGVIVDGTKSTPLPGNLTCKKN